MRRVVGVSQAQVPVCAGTSVPTSLPVCELSEIVLTTSSIFGWS